MKNKRTGFLRLKAVHELTQKLAIKVAECMVVIKILIDKNIITKEEVEEEFQKLYGTSKADTK